MKKTAKLSRKTELLSITRAVIKITKKKSQLPALSEHDENFRRECLGGNIWKLVIMTGFPLALYQGLSHVFTVMDTLLAAQIDASSVSAVAYISQLHILLSAIGAGLAVGSSIKISDAFGKGDYPTVKKQVSTLCAAAAIIGGLMLLLLPFAEPFLRLAGTPESLIGVGRDYFIVDILALVVSFFNGIYFAIERVSGNTKRILLLNLVMIAVKSSMTVFFVFVLKCDVTMLAVPTLVCNLFVFVYALIKLNKKNSVFGFSVKEVDFKKVLFLPMLKMSFPVMAERFAFSLGKVIVNAMCNVYGDTTVGALGISNNIGGLTSSPQNGFQDSGAAIISQNMGVDNFSRAKKIFYVTLVVNTIIGIIGFVLTMVFLSPISALFAKGDETFRSVICNIYACESIGLVTLGINAAVMALLYGLGYTKITLLLNFCRIFVFRVPVLWFFQCFTEMGAQSIGIVMMISNVSVGVISLLTAVIVIRKRRT